MKGVQMEIFNNSIELEKLAKKNTKVKVKVQ
jgi:hypothetical protein